MKYRILTINPGSTSTKIAVFENDKNLFQQSLQHYSSELKQYGKITEQFAFRRQAILEVLKEAGYRLSDFHAVVGRGGMLRPVPSGVFAVNRQMIADLLAGRYGEHASNLGALIADDLTKDLPHVKVFIADPVVVDELQDVARVSGHPAFRRVSIFHALNHKAIARQHARQVGRPYEALNLVVAHLGGGVSVGAHKGGRIIDVNNALGGEGPFSPERSGSVPCLALAELCFSGKYTLPQVAKMLIGEGGTVAHLGTNQFLKIEKEMLPAGDRKAALVHEAMAYQIAKSIGAMTTVFEGRVDAILITGGIAWNPLIVESIKKKVAFLAPVIVYPGEDEMAALAANGLAALTGEAEVMEY